MADAAASVVAVCATAGCGKPAKMICPTCMLVVLDLCPQPAFVSCSCLLFCDWLAHARSRTPRVTTPIRLYLSVVCVDAVVACGAGVQLGMPPTNFCDQDCFKANWKVHNAAHKCTRV